MALVIDDRVRETTTVTGTNDATLLGAVTGFQAFSVIGNGNTTYYTISDQSGGNWEVGIGTYSSIGPTLARTTILSSSAGGAKVNFPAGTKDVFVTYPSEKAVYLDASGNITPSSVGPLTVSSLTDSGNLTFTGTGNRITGVFTATAASVNFQTSVTNSPTYVSAIPNGTGVFSGYLAWNDSTISSTSSYGGIIINSSAFEITTDKSASGTYLPMLFKTGGSERMRIATNGNVGIGTANPIFKLDIVDESNATFGFTEYSNADGPTIRLYRATGTIASPTVATAGASLGGLRTFGYTGSGFGSLSAAIDLYANQTFSPTAQGSYINFRTTADSTASPTEKMRITGAGDVGIGTSAPEGRLQANASSAFASAIIARSDASAVNWARMDWKNNNVALTGLIYLTQSATFSIRNDNAGPITFLTDGGNERMRIDSAGNVGIGINNAGAYGKFGVGGSGYQAVFAISTDASGAVGILAANSSTEVRVGSVTNHPVTIRTNDTERMRITAAGDVGIGTTNPSGRLEVLGGVANTIANAGTADAATLTITNSDVSGIGRIAKTLYEIGNLPIASISGVYTDFNAGSDIGGALAFSTQTNLAGGVLERMRITSAGNVGIGTSSPNGSLNIGTSGSATATPLALLAYNSTGLGAALDDMRYISEFGGSTGNSLRLMFALHRTVAGSDWTTSAWRIQPAVDSSFTGVGSNRGYVELAFGNLGSYQGIGLSGSGAITPDFIVNQSGNVGIGTTAPSARLEVAKASGASDIRLSVAGTVYANIYASASDFTINSVTAIPITFGTNSTERMRIDSSGNLLVGTTTAVSPVGTTTSGFTYNVSSSYYELRLANNNGSCGAFQRNGTDGSLFAFFKGTTNVGSIGVTASATSFNTSSDYRLKENIAPMTGALDTVAQLKPVTYNWKADGSSGQGFIAHELQAVVPECVTGEKDAVDAEGKPVYQGIDTSFLVATLTKAIQEQQKLIENLTTRLNALEGK